MPSDLPSGTTGDPLSELAHRVRNLEIRVEHLEQEKAHAPAGAPHAATGSAAPPLPAFFPASPISAQAVSPPASPPPLRRLEFELNPLEQRAAALSRVARERVAMAPTVTATGGEQASVAASRPVKPGSQPKPLDLEQLVGGRWFAAIGALAVTIGVGLFVKLAYDHGWLRVPPVWRCAGGAGFGVVLIVCAEWLRGKFGKWAAFGSYSAGLGAIYVSTFLAHRLYDLMPAPAAFATMAAVAVFGLLISVRAKLQAVGVMSLLAGYLAPFLLVDAPDKPLVLPAYLLALQAIGLGLVAFRAGSFGVVRQVVTWGTVALGAFWLIWNGMHTGWWAQAFMVVAWGLTHAELTWTAIGARKGEDEDGRRVSVLRSGGAAMVASLGVTGWWVGIGSSLADRTGLLPAWLVPLGACGATALLGMFVSGSGLLLDRAAHTAREALGQCLIALSAALLAITVTLALDGPSEVIAWLALGVAATVMAWRMRMKAVRVYGCVLLGIGTGRLMMYDLWAGMHTGGLDFAGLHLTTWTAMMTVAGLAWMGVLLTSSRDVKLRSPVATVLFTTGACLPLFMGLMHKDTPMSALTWAWLGLVTLVAAARGTPKLPLDRAAGALFILPCAAWGVSIANTVIDGNGSLPYDAATCVRGIAIGLAGFGIAWWIRSRRGDQLIGVPGALALVAASAVAFAASSMGVAAAAITATDDLLARRAAISLWWGVLAVTLIVIGFRLSRRAVRHAGLGLLGLAAIKVVTFDLVEVSPAWRIASFIVLGLLMLGVAVGYGRMSARQRKDTEGATVPDTGDL